MTYAELIEQLKPYADNEVFVDGFENRYNTGVVFSVGDKDVLTLSRRYGEDEVTLRIDQP